MTVLGVYRKFPFSAVNSQPDPRENHLTTVTGEETHFQPVILNTVNFLKIFFYPEFEVRVCTYIYI